MSANPTFSTCTTTSPAASATSKPACTPSAPSAESGDSIPPTLFAHGTSRSTASATPPRPHAPRYQKRSGIGALMGGPIVITGSVLADTRRPVRHPPRTRCAPPGATRRDRPTNAATGCCWIHRNQRPSQDSSVPESWPSGPNSPISTGPSGSGRLIFRDFLYYQTSVRERVRRIEINPAPDARSPPHGTPPTRSPNPR